MRFCERHSTWDLENLRSALPSEGREVYARMVENHVAEMRVRERDHLLLTRHAEPHGPPRGDVHGRWRNWWGQWRNSISSLAHRALPAGTGCQARARGIHLLKKNLSPAQRDHYEKFGHFHVTGGTTGKRYRIRNGHQMNVEQLDKNGNLVSLWCFMPKGGLVDGDVMLAQKLALELFEPDALSVANKISAKYSLLSPMP